MTSKSLGVASARKTLEWSQKALADALDVAPLTVQRWEKAERDRESKSRTGKGKRIRGRPAQIPPFLSYALNYLLLKEGKKKGSTFITMALPDSVGAALPTLALDHGFFKKRDLVVELRRCETGTEALENLYEERAQIAGAASGLLKKYSETITEIGTLMLSPRAFNVITYAEQGREEFKRSIILHPKGSDLERLLHKLHNYYAKDEQPVLQPVDRRDAVEELLKAARGSVTKDPEHRNTLYIAWEPLASWVQRDLQDHNHDGIEFRSHEPQMHGLEGALSYEFRIVCSTKWYEQHPAEAFDFMCALAQADLEFKQHSLTYMNELWKFYGLERRTESNWIEDLFGSVEAVPGADNVTHTFEGNPPRYAIQFRPSTALFRLLGRDRIAVVGRAEFNE